jgi:FMN-dependent oxidoreductase (nitrilotriacetate monooxygenase family)
VAPHPRRRMHLAGFLIAGNCAHSHALWRHPRSGRDFLAAAHYQTVARSLERGLFDLVFFADRLAMSSRYGGSIEVGARHGDQDATRLDPLPVLGAMAAVTSRIGLGATRSTTYARPYSLAREFATLDHLSGGRAAWNVVTSVNQGEADNFGLESHLGHDERYDAADEFMELVSALWGSWAPDALVLDRERGVYADPARIRAVDHAGRFFRCRGPLNIPRTPQGRPVIIQAGSSARGQDFAARWAEVVFSIQPDPDRMRRFRDDLRARAERQGRDPSAVKVLTAVMPFVAASRAEAEERREEHNALVHPLVGLSTLSSHMNADFAGLPLDAPVADLKVEGMRGLFEVVRHLSGQGMTLAEVGRRYGESVLVPQLAGTPGDVADRLEALFAAGACDGFVVTPAHLPHGFDDFAAGVVPELQRRGLFRERYEGTTLREHLLDERA